MEKLTITIKGVTHAFDIDLKEARVHITLAKAIATFGLEGSGFELVPAAQAEHITDRDSETVS